MPSTKKTYTLLIDIQPPIPILSCSQVLPNRAQCWRGADYLVEEELPTKTETTPATQPASTPPKEGALKALEHKIEAAIEHKKEATQKTTTAVQTAPPPATRSFQLCSMHAIIMQRADAIADQEEASGKEQPPAGEKGSIHSKMMQAEQVQRTTSMPRGEVGG